MFDRVSYQGLTGAYSHAAVRLLLPHAEAISCPTFATALQTVKTGMADAALLPIENSTAGRVMELYSQLPDVGLHIVEEHYHPIHHCLHGRGALAEVTEVYSHPQALAQCATWLEKHDIKAIPVLDTAGAVKELALHGKPHQAAIAAKDASLTYGLHILAEDIQNMYNNTTRFVLFAREGMVKLPALTKACKTAVLIEVNNKPSALAEVLLCFGKQNLNLVKLESYINADTFKMAQFFVEIEGHIESTAMQSAFIEMVPYIHKKQMLGCYVAKKQVHHK